MINAQIVSVSPIDNSSVNMTVSFSQTDGTLITTQTFGIATTGTDQAACLAYLKQSFQNVLNHYISVNSSVTTNVANSLVGKVIQI